MTTEFATRPTEWLITHERAVGAKARAILAEARHGPPAVRARYAVDLIRNYVLASAHIEEAATHD